MAFGGDRERVNRLKGGDLLQTVSNLHILLSIIAKHCESLLLATMNASIMKCINPSSLTEFEEMLRQITQTFIEVDEEWFLQYQRSLEEKAGVM